MNNYFNHRTLLAIFTIMILGVFVFPVATHAMTLTPTRFEIRGNPGDTLNEEFSIINETPFAETYYSSFANFEAQGDTGTPAFVDPKDGLGTWMTTTPSITIAPGQQKVIPFKIEIPKGADAGGHFAVVFWGTSAPNANGGVGVGAKTGILVLLSVNGDVKEAGGLLNFNTKGSKFFFNTLPVTFEYRFKNDGGDRIKPIGTIGIKDTIFIPTDSLNANISGGNILPVSTRKFSVDWVKHERPTDYIAPTGIFKRFWSDVSYQWSNFAMGLYSAHLNLAYGINGTQVNKTVWFFVFPWQLIMVMLLVLIILYWGGKRSIKSYNRFIIERARAGMGRVDQVPPNSFHDKSSN